MAYLFHCLLKQYYDKIWKNVKMVTLKFLDDCTDLLLFFKADYFLLCCAVLYCTVSQSCLILCDPMDCSLSGSPVHGYSPGKNAGVDCHALIQGLFPTQGSNPGFTRCRWILYWPSHQILPIFFYLSWKCCCYFKVIDVGIFYHLFFCIFTSSENVLSWLWLWNSLNIQ